MQHGDLSALQIKRLYEELIRQITPLMSGLVFSPDEPFSFLKNAKINQLLNQFLAEISQKMRISIERSTIQAWELSVLNNQKFFEPYLNSGLLSAEQILHYNNRNIEALQSFLNRKTNGLNLSQRIWNLNSQFKTELEMSLDIGLSQGKPAQEIALDILNYMHQPNALLQKVRQFRGSKHLSQMVNRMKKQDPVLGSSYNKAMRLARTEVNMAYRASDLEKYRQLDFVLGYEIKRSNHPYGCPVCESLKGKYPKDFQFVGWHPNCRCYTVPILQPLDDFINDLNHEQSTKNYIEDVPDNFKQWVKDNSERMQNAQSVPYWWKDNKGYVDKVLNEKKESILDKYTDKLKKIGVQYKEVKLLKNRLSEEDIIMRVSGGDLTKGSCSSLCFAYAGNKNGLDVLDFRDGESRFFFATNIDKIILDMGGILERNYNDFVSANKLLATAQNNKEYILSVGKHASIVRKTDKGWEFLELQSPILNGYKPLTTQKLKERFGCQKSHSKYGQKYEVPATIIDIEKLNGEDFKKLLGYINTDIDLQRKGIKGKIK